MKTQLPEAYALLLAKLHALEQEMAVLREELADLRVRVGEAGFDGRP